MMNKNCQKCGKAIQPGDKFCPACGHPTRGKADVTAAGRRDHYIVLGILAVVVVAYLGYTALKPSKSVPPKPAQSQPEEGMPVDMEGFINSLPTEFSSLVSMGNALMDQSQFEMAVECYQKALEQKPKEVDIIVDLGACRHSLGQDQEAINNFKKALEYDPHHQVALFNLGIVYYGLGDDTQAVDWWNRLLAENPSPEVKERVEHLIRQAQEN